MYRPRPVLFPPWKLSVHIPSIWNKWLNGISKTDPSEDDFIVLKDVTLAPARDPHHLPVDDAVRLVIASLREHEHDLQLCHRSQSLHRDLRNLPFKVFNDIDESIFAGVLRRNVLLCWSNLPNNVSGKTSRWEDSSCLRIKIELSMRLIREESRQGLLEALVHQMIHAYLLQICSKKVPAASGPDPDLAHGKRFCTISYIILEHVIGRKVQNYECPCHFGCPLTQGQRITRNPHRRLLLPRPSPSTGSSMCCVQNGTYDRLECDKYLSGILNKSSIPQLDLMKDILVDSDSTHRPISQYVYVFGNDGDVPIPCLRSNFRPESDGIEIRMDNHFIPIPIGKLPDSSLSGKLSKNRVLKVPTANWNNIFRLISFIQDGAYKPDIEARKVGLPGGSYGPAQAISEGPPRILPRRDANDDFLIFDIDAYRLASAIGYLELCAYALGRMKAQTYTHDDPCKILETIYHSSSPPKSDDALKEEDSSESINGVGQRTLLPDEKLRTWVKTWLKVSGRDATYANNLQVLQKDPVWKGKYAKLRERGSKMITDIDTVEAELAEEYAELGPAKAEIPLHAKLHNRFQCGTYSGYPALHYNQPHRVPTPVYPTEALDMVPYGGMNLHQQVPEASWTSLLDLRLEDGHGPYFQEPTPYDGRLTMPLIRRQGRDLFPHDQNLWNHRG